MSVCVLTLIDVDPDSLPGSRGVLLVLLAQGGGGFLDETWQLPTAEGSGDHGCAVAAAWVFPVAAGRSWLI